MKCLLRLIVSCALLVTPISACSTLRIDTPDFDFLTKATREVGRDKEGIYEDYTSRDIRVRFYTTDTPADLQS
jgi:hypothetical protein